MSWKSTPVSVSVLNGLSHSLCFITGAAGETQMDQPVQSTLLCCMASVSLAACYCYCSTHVNTPTYSLMSYPHTGFNIHHHVCLLRLSVLTWLRLLSFQLPPRPVGAAEGSGHGSGEELAGDLSQRGDHDGGLVPESLPGSGQEEGGPDHHRLRDRAAHRHPQKGKEPLARFRCRPGHYVITSQCNSSLMATAS